MFTNSTRIFELTVEEFKQLLREEREEKQQPPQPDEVIRGCKAIAKFFGISERTLQEWRKNRIIGEPTIFQIGNVVMANKNDLLNFKPKQNGRRPRTHSDNN